MSTILKRPLYKLARSLEASFHQNNYKKDRFSEIKKAAGLGTYVLCHNEDLMVSGSRSVGSGRASEIIDKLTDDSSYVSLFITHFLNTPAENFGILRKLYINLKRSIRNIEKLT